MFEDAYRASGDICPYCQTPSYVGHSLCFGGGGDGPDPVDYGGNHKCDNCDKYYHREVKTVVTHANSKLDCLNGLSFHQFTEDGTICIKCKSYHKTTTR